MHSVPVGFRKRIEPIYRRRIRIEPCVDERGRLWGHRTIFQQPTISTLMILAQEAEAHHAKLCRVDIAYDFFKYSREWILQHVIFRRRRRGIMRDKCTTTYWAWTNDGERSGRNLVLYSDRPSKVAGKGNVTHLELRLLNAGAVRRAGFSSVRDLIRVDPRAVFEHNIKLVDFDGAKLIRQVMRQAVSHDRKKYPKPTSSFSDRYRASITHRIRSLLLRSEVAYRAQRLKDLLPTRAANWKPISIDVLELPRCL